MLTGKRAVFRNKGEEIAGAFSGVVENKDLFLESCEAFLNKADIKTLALKLNAKTSSKKGQAKSEDFKTFMKNMKKGSQGEEKENFVKDEGF